MEANENMIPQTERVEDEYVRIGTTLFRIFVIVKTCSDKSHTIGQKKCPMFAAKIRNYFHSHNLMKP